MRVNIQNNVISVITDIKLETAKKNLISPILCDDKGNVLYQIKVDPDGKGALSKFGITANSVTEDGKLTVVIVEEMGITVEEIKQKYGQAVIAAKKFCPLYAAEADEAEAAIEEAFRN